VRLGIFLLLVLPSAWACTRPVPGASVRNPVELRSSDGKLQVDFMLRTSVDVYGLTLYCYVSNDNVESPTLRVKPGDEIVLILRNDLPPADAVPGHHHTSTKACTGGAGKMTASSTNLHFHGLGIPPTCHQDEVLHTAVQPGDPAFEYRIKIPPNQPPGLYWYHPHPHGFSERQVLGGASGAMIVEGIEQGLTERVLILRDQRIGGVAEDADSSEDDRPSIPTLDLSLNYVPIMFPLYKPAVMLVRPNQREFWRVLNASADTFFDLQLLYWPDKNTQIEQSVEVVAVDGVPVGKDYASVARKSVLLPPGSRVEFVMTTPPAGMYAQLLTKRYENGPVGNTDSYRVLANIRSLSDAPSVKETTPPSSAKGQPFSGLTSLPVARARTLYFSETPAHPKQNVSYFLTAGDAKPKVFDMNATKPDLTAVQGTLEDWTIENRTQESHVFHIHQLHFQLIEKDGVRMNESALRDTIELPFWDGKSTTYPRIKLRMDFRNPNIVGTFLYHCHILEHEDGGMMGSIEVIPAPNPSH
jgi:FtsP/CotA-like multicopper oxidase with cupredoxin domain